MAAKHCCGHIADSHLFHAFGFGFLLLLRVKDAALYPRDGYRRGMRLFLHAGAAPATSLLMRPGMGERHGGEERCFEEPALKNETF